MSRGFSGDLALPSWATRGTRLIPLTDRARRKLAWFDKKGKPSYMRVGSVDPNDEIPIHLIACDESGGILGSANLWRDNRGAPHDPGWGDDDWAIDPGPPRPTLWARLLDDAL